MSHERIGDARSERVSALDVRQVVEARQRGRGRGTGRAQAAAETLPQRQRALDVGRAAGERRGDAARRGSC